MDDSQIVDLYLSRDETAISQTAKKYGTRLQRMAHSIVEDRQTAEECENDIYLQAWQRIPPHEPRTYFYVFLSRITRNLSVDRCRSRDRLKRQAHICELSAELECCIPAPDDTLCRMEGHLLADIISTFLKKLPEAQRNVFLILPCGDWSVAIDPVKMQTALLE